MHINLLQEKLVLHHQSFSFLMSAMNDEDFVTSKNGKWSPAQHFKHIYISVRIVRLVTGLPSFLLRWIWGKSNRNGRTYEALVEKYQQKLLAGGRASGRFLPGKVTVAEGRRTEQKLLEEVKKLCNILNHYDEKKMDQLILPHPLLGKLTLREMIYFTIYHVQHHENSVKNNL